MNAAQSVQALHDQCAIYTASPTAAKLLDLAGWTAEIDLREAKLLEPCVGEGAILVEAVRRLVGSLRRFGVDVSRETLTDRITSFEIHPATAAIARSTVERLLVGEGLPPRSAKWLARTWIRQQDFLTQPATGASHVVANPPYVRWSKLPPSLATTYRSTLRTEVTRGDLSVAFIDRMLDWAIDGGAVVALVSDRWMFAQYGEAFLAEIGGLGWHLQVHEARPESPFVREVGAYSAIVGFRRLDAKQREECTASSPRGAERRLHGELVARHGTIIAAGCTVRVGPALGCGHTFILEELRSGGIEPELLHPYAGRANLVDGQTRPSGSVVVAPYDVSGRPIALEDWPGFATWVAQHREILSARSCVRSGGPWWRTIDAIGTQWRQSPKLLVPELCRVPSAALDQSGAIPAHSIYAIWPGEWPADALQRVLNAGLLRITAEAQAPMLKHGWFRFYRRFLAQTPLPKWTTLTPPQQAALTSCAVDAFSEAFEELFGIAPDRPPSQISITDA